MKNRNLFGEYKEITEEPKETKPKEKVFGYKPFALQDAIGQKNVKRAWIEYEKLRLAGIEAEELIYKVISKAREMLAMSKGADEEDLNIKNPTYNKSKRDAKNWEGEDLRNFYTKLIKAYHIHRMESGRDLDTDLEKILLSI